MNNESTAIQKFTGNDEQRLALLAEYKAYEHLIQWSAKGRSGKQETINYYPAAWRLYELSLRYPNANFSNEIIHMDPERNFCIVRSRLYLGTDYDTSEKRAEAHKQGFLTELDRVETKAMARAARNWGIGTEFALDFDDTPENEVKPTTVNEESNPPQRQVQTQRPKQVSQLSNESKARLNALYERAMAARMLKASNAKAFLMRCSEILGEAIVKPEQLTKEKLDQVEQCIVAKEKEASESQQDELEAPVEEVVEA